MFKTLRVSVELHSVLELLAKITKLPGGDVKPSRNPPRWERWMSIVSEHQLAPLVASRLLLANAERESGLPRWVEDALIGAYARTGHETAFRSTELARLLKLFDKDHAPVLLKGAALAHTLYNEAAERPMSDFDLLLSSQDALRSARLLLGRESYRVQKKEDGVVTKIGHHHDAPIESSLSELVIELHTNLTTPPLPKAAIADMWRRRRRVDVPGFDHFYMLDPVSALMHHALHAISDPVDSPLLRNLLEVAWLANNLDQSDLASVRTLSERWGVAGRMSVAMDLASRLFGSPRVFRAPFFDLRTHWSLARLEWTRSFSGELDTAQRFRRHLARMHLKAIAAGASAQSPLPLARTVFDSLKNAVLTRLEKKTIRRLPSHVEPVRMPAALVAHCLLAHDTKSGNVHMLDRASTEVYQRLAGTTPLGLLAKDLEASGATGGRARIAIERMLDAGLIRAPPQSTQAE